MRMKMLLLGTCTALLALPAFAQTHSTNPMKGMTRFAGTVQKVDPKGHEFEIIGRGGTAATYQLSSSTRISVSQAGTLADLQSGKFVGCTAVQHHDGKLHATECHIFPESMRGTGEGHTKMRPPHTTMTNGDITSMTNGDVKAAQGSSSGKVLHITYKGGAQDIEVSPRTHITVIKTGTTSMVKPGVMVMGAARKASDGAEVAQMLFIAPAHQGGHARGHMRHHHHG